MKMSSQMRILPMLAVIMFISLIAKSVNAANLAPHRAVYSIKLGDINSGANLEAARGLMIVSLEKSCEGWVVSQHMNMELQTAEGQKITQDYRFAGWESLDLKSYRFAVHTRMEGNDEAFKGKAQLLAQGDGNVFYTVPQKKILKLPKNTLFPIGYLALLIDSAIAGTKQISRPVFEGTEGTGHQSVSAFIGPSVGPEKHGWKERGPLLDRKGWKINLGYYDAGSQSSAPKFEIEVLQLDNGVVPHLVQIFPTFSLIIKLKKIENLPIPVC